MSEPAALPQLQDQVVDWSVVDDLLRDISACTRLFAVLVRGAPDTMAGGAPADVSSARAALASGAAVQLRYVYDDIEWWDTLMPAGDAIRILRVSQGRVVVTTS